MDWAGQLTLWIQEPWEFEFMRRGILAMVLISVCCALIGNHVILRRLSFIGDGLAHATFGGLAAGFLLKADLFVSAMVASLCTAFGIGTISRKADISLDTSIGIMFSSVFALGIMVISHDRGYRGNLFDLLLGNILSIGQSDLLIIAGTTLLVASCLIGMYKELLFSAFDPSGAQAAGIPVVWLDLGLLALIAVTVTAALKTVGVILVSSLLVTPAASAMQLTSRFAPMLLLSSLFGVMSGLIGIYVSYYFDVPAGAAVVLTATIIFFLCLAVSPKRGAVKVPAIDQEAALVPAGGDDAH